MMSSFTSYNTSDTTSGNVPLTANQVVTIGPFQSGTSLRLAGSVFADQAGTVSIQQSMDGGLHFDIVDTFTVVLGVPQKLEVDVIAPVTQIVYTNGGADQGALRIF